MKWSAIITTYNSEAVIGRALESILSLGGPEKPVDIVVVDNASSDSTREVVRGFGNAVRLLGNTVNLGLSRANNMGAEVAQGDSLFFLNPDVELLDGSVSALWDFQESHGKAALLGPGMIDENGVVQSTARTWPSLITVAARRTAFGKTFMGRRIANRHMNRFQGTEPVKPHWLVGAAMWLTPWGRRTAGLMSERYFLYFEDVEWCFRTWKNHGEVWLVPQALIRHVCRRESTTSTRAMNLHLRSMIRFFLEHPATALGWGR